MIVAAVVFGDIMFGWRRIASSVTYVGRRLLRRSRVSVRAISSGVDGATVTEQAMSRLRALRFGCRLLCRLCCCRLRLVVFGFVTYGTVRFCLFYGFKVTVCHVWSRSVVSGR